MIPSGHEGSYEEKVFTDPNYMTARKMKFVQHMPKWCFSLNEFVVTGNFYIWPNKYRGEGKSPGHADIQLQVFWLRE